MTANVAAAAEARLELRAETSHLHNWDRLRVLASLDILGSHLTGTHLFGGVGLPAFLIVSLALSVRRPRAGDSATFLRKRIARVLVPWMVWSSVISLVFAIHAAERGEPTWGWVKPAMLLYGPEIHLWFLPFIVVASAAVHGAHRLTECWPARRVAWLSCAAGGGALALCPALECGWPFEQWGFSLPAVCLGFGVGRLLVDEPARRFVRLELVLLAATFAAFAALLHQVLPDTAPYAERHAGAILFVALAACLPNPSDSLTAQLAPLMLGVYMLHLLVFRELIEPAFRHATLTLTDTPRVALVFAVTAGAVALARRGPLRRVL